MATTGHDHRQHMASLSSASSSSSSSSASSVGLRTPQWGATNDPHLANLDVDVDIKSLKLEDGSSTGKKLSRYNDVQPSSTLTNDSPPSMFVELPAPPPLSLPRAFLPPITHPRTTLSTSPHHAYSPPTEYTDLSTTPTSTRPSTIPLSRQSSSSSSTTTSRRPSIPKPRTSFPPLPLHKPLQPFSPLYTQKRPPLEILRAHTSPVLPSSNRRKRGRSSSIHILWSSSIDDEAFKVLKGFYEFKMGEQWPELDCDCAGDWSLKVEAAGL